VIALNLQIDIGKFVKQIAHEQRQLPYIMALAINQTNTQKQTQITEHVDRVLSIRSPSAARIFREVVRYGRDNRADSKAGRLVGEIQVLGRGVAARTPQHAAISNILLRQDDAGPQTSIALYRAQSGQLTTGGFAIPTLPRTDTRGVDPKLYPAALGLTERRAIEGGFHFAGRSKGGKKSGGYKAGARYYFVEEGVGIFERRTLKKSKAQKARDRKPKNLKRGTALYYDNEHVGALTKAMKAGHRQPPLNTVGASRGTDDQNSEYTQIWFFRRQIDLPKRVDIFGVFENRLEELFSASWDNAYTFAMATAR